MRTLSKIWLVTLGAAAACSCSSGAGNLFGSGGGSGQAGGGSPVSSSSGQTSSSTTGSSSSGQAGGSSVSSSSGQAGGGSSVSSSSGQASSSNTGSSSSGNGGCHVTDPNADMDGDGWTPAQGDCNDCDPNVNPGAVDVPGDPNHVDHDCNGTYDPPVPCDSALALDDVDADDAARAIELCQFTTETAPLQQKVWGVISSEYVRANGAPFATPGLQVGIQSIFGSSVNPQGGQNMLAISSGHARTTNQTGACGTDSCQENAAGTPPPGFPQPIPNCPPSTIITDDVGLQLDIRAPTNATGYSFSFKFYSMEFPYWVCDQYNDQFVVLASPAPLGTVNGNISFDGMLNPVSTAFGFIEVCDPTQIGMYAYDCHNNGTASCPAAPNPYCPSGTGQLQGTGFDVWDTTYGGAGATIWLTSQASVQPGSELTLRFTIWDGGDQELDSTALIDNFQWITSGGNVPVATGPIAQPK